MASNDQKDRLGQKLHDVERGREEHFFAERDRELIEKLKKAKEQEQETTLREVAQMRCPKCGQHLVERHLRGVTVDECPDCKGMWLDHGEIERALQQAQESSTYFTEWLGKWLRGERD